MNAGDNSASFSISDLRKIVKEMEDQGDESNQSNACFLKDSIKETLAQMEKYQEKQEITIKSINESIEQIKKQQDLFTKLMNESLEQLKKNQYLLKKSIRKSNDNTIKDSINQIEQQHGAFKVQLEKLQDQSDKEHCEFITICDNFKNISSKM
ncbi:hypothetical protein M9Y10_017821 [Tritrichomonas musculus]|uniref:Uncharacterized protein n=1 Tax=Tritrichomonas musculus TaxID=1915356 RepID=A0ABR2HVD8_9EUKA